MKLLPSKIWKEMSGYDNLLTYYEMTGSPYHYFGNDTWVAPCGNFVEDNYGCKCEKCKKVAKFLPFK